MKYSPEKTTEICRRIELGDNQEEAAVLCDICEDTFYEWMKKPEFSEAIKKATLKCKSRNISIIQKAGLTHWQAAAWWLERKCSSEFALRNTIQHGFGGQDSDGKWIPYSVNILIDPSVATTNGHNGNGKDAGHKAQP